MGATAPIPVLLQSELHDSNLSMGTHSVFHTAIGKPGCIECPLSTVGSMGDAFDRVLITASRRTLVLPVIQG